MPATYGDTSVATAIASISTRAVDFVGSGDSNQLFGGTGWDHGLQYGLDAEGYAMHATGLVQPNSGGGSGAGAGFKFQETSINDLGATSGAPAGVADYMGSSDINRMFPQAYLAEGVAATTGQPHGIRLDFDCPVDVNANLQWQVWAGTFDSGTGTWEQAVRQEGSPFARFTGSTITTNTGTIGETKYTQDIAAATRNYAMTGGIFVPSEDTPTGLATFHRMRVRNTDRTAGYSYTTLVNEAGDSLRVQALALINESDTFLTAFFGSLRDEQIAMGHTPQIVVTIHSGANDRNETNTSVGPDAVADGDSPEAYADNGVALINRVEEIFTDNDWSTGEVMFLWIPTHPISDPDDAELRSYVTAAQGVADDRGRVLVIDIEALADSGSISSNGWYASGGSDTIHLDSTGYEGLGELIIERIGEVADMSTYQSTVLGLSPTHYWTLDETTGTTFADLAGSNDCTYGSNVFKDQDPLIQDGRAVELQGSVNAWTVTDSGVATDAGFSVAAWIKTDKTGTRIICAQQDGTGTGRNPLYLVNGIPYCNFGGTAIFGSVAINDDQPHLLTATFSGGTGGDVKLYVDGAEVASGTETGEGATGSLVFGASKTLGSNFFGNLDEIAFWAGTALTAEQVQSIYLAGSPPSFQSITNGLLSGIIGQSLRGRM